MLAGRPILIKQREVDDNELQRMLLSVRSNGDTLDFFRHFGYKGEAHDTLAYGQSLLSKCKALAPDVYKTLHKGTPFYWLAEAAFLVNDYETAAFYIDAAVSEDLRVDPTNTATPALLFFKIDSSVPGQAARELVHLLETTTDAAIMDYNKRGDASSPPLTFDEFRASFLEFATLSGNEHLRTLVTTFISFILEWKHRYSLMEVRPESGTAEPFFIHLFKGCLLFESLLKAKTNKKGKKLETLLRELQSRFGFGSKPKMVITAAEFQTIINDLPSDDSSVYKAIVRTGRIRNTTGHNLGWQVALDPMAYNTLVESVATSCLHALACLYR